MLKLKCECGASMELEIVYDGCDWECIEGEGSGYYYTIALTCSKCPNVCELGKVKNESDFSFMSRSK